MDQPEMPSNELRLDCHGNDRVCMRTKFNTLHFNYPQEQYMFVKQLGKDLDHRVPTTVESNPVFCPLSWFSISRILSFSK